MSRRLSFISSVASFFRDVEFEQADKKKGNSYVVLLTELLGKRSAHDGAAHAGRSRKVRLARLSPGGGKSCSGQLVRFISSSLSRQVRRRTGVDLGHFGGVGRIVVIKCRRC